MSGPSLSRRDLLRVGSVGVGAALAGCVGGDSMSFETWTPESGTWPLARYGPRNSGHNPNATPPRDGVERAWQVDTGVSARGLVVAHGLVVAYGDEGMVVAPRSNPDYEWPDNEWREELPTSAAGFGPRDEQGRLPLYAGGGIGHRDGAAMGLLRGWTFSPDDRSGRSQSFWRSYESGSDGPSGLVTSADTLYVGHASDTPLVAFDAADGSTRWRADGGYPALGDDRLVASEYYAVSGYEARRGLDARLNGGPAEAWTADGGRRRAPALVDGRVFLGQGFDFQDEPTLYGYDAATGEALWGPRNLADSAETPVVVGDTGFVAVSNYEDVGPYHDATSGAFLAVNLGDGSVNWRRETEWAPGPVAAGGNGVVVLAGDVREGEELGRMRAHDAESGEPLWTVSTPGSVDTVALVGSTVYAGSRDGSVYAFEAA